MVVNRPTIYNETLNAFENTMIFRDLINQGLAPGPITQNALLAIFIPLILGKIREILLSTEISFVDFKELPKLYRTYSSDPEQRPRIVEDVKKHYDFIIVGNAFGYCLS